ncbi:histidine kinase [Streptomyces sp. SID3343]|uniref:helix-turn-helix transcriptional regulator n=1 Tax=Streptomyces sp. SID3343 TaxID=2690260 RepID=UPI001367D1DD|nr:histidine kinase [Streptomyces sp. SID3343]MYW02345.1 sensor histidine kinase [Streptomyces sp. SID3343]
MGSGSSSMALLGKAITGRDLAATDPSGGPGRAAARRPFPARIRTDALIALVVAPVDVFGYVMIVPTGGPRMTALGVALLVASALCLIARRRAPVVVLALVLGFQTVINVGVGSWTGIGFSMAVALYTVVLACRPLVVGAAALATLAVQLTGYPAAEDPFVWTFSVTVVAIALVLGVGVAVRHWQGQAEVTRILLAERALTDERRRIARELHDIVAHHITTMHLMSAGARSSLERDLGAARTALLTLEASGRVALGEMRQLLGILRSDNDPDTASSTPQPGVDDLPRLIAESCLAGLPTEYRVDGARRELPLPIGLALYRITQEALTNARKHAGNGATARVRLEYLPREVAIEIRDDGGGDDAGSGGCAMTGGGHGLLGMRERVAVHDGSFEAARRMDGGFTVTARIPVAPAGPTASITYGPPTRAATPESLAHLTPSEIAVLRLIAAGKENRAIAEALSTGVSAVERHEADMLAKLSLEDRAQAVVLAYESGLVRAGHTTRSAP